MEKDKNIYEDMSMVNVALKILEETKKTRYDCKYSCRSI